MTVVSKSVRFLSMVALHSTRYLSLSQADDELTADELIDKIVIMEIKVLLQNTTLPIQEIAYKMHF